MKSSWYEEQSMLNNWTIAYSVLAAYIYVFVLPLWFSQASLDQPTQTVVMHRTEPTSLQNMALQLAEKLGGLVENNERVFDLKQGVYGGYFNRGSVFGIIGILCANGYTKVFFVSIQFISILQSSSRVNTLYRRISKKLFFFCNFTSKSKLSYNLVSLHTKGNILSFFLF